MSLPSPSASECCNGLPKTLEQLRGSTMDCFQKKPLKAAGFAFGAGLFCALFPVGRILGALLQLALALVRPALLLLGLVKIFEEIDRRNPAGKSKGGCGPEAGQ